MTSAEWSEWYSDTNVYDKRTTSKYRRSLTSAEDDRRSAVSVGVVAVSFMAAVGVLTVIMDVIKVIFIQRCSLEDE